MELASYEPTFTNNNIFNAWLLFNQFENYLGQVYPVELEIKDTTESNTSASYLHLLLSIGRDGQLHTSINDKRDDLNFHITNFPFLSNIPTSPAYVVFISQLMRYARACSSYGCFNLRATRLSNKLLEQGYVKERLKSSLRKFYGLYGDLIKQYEVSLSQMLNDILWPDHIQWQPPTDQTFYRTRPFTEFWEAFIEYLRRVWHADRGRLLLRTPGPVPLGLAYVLLVETNPFSELVVIFPDYAFRISLGTFLILPLSFTNQWYEKTYIILTIGKPCNNAFKLCFTKLSFLFCTWQKHWFYVCCSIHVCTYRYLRSLYPVLAKSKIVCIYWFSLALKVQTSNGCLYFKKKLKII